MSLFNVLCDTITGSQTDTSDSMYAQMIRKKGKKVVRKSNTRRLVEATGDLNTAFYGERDHFEKFGYATFQININPDGPKLRHVSFADEHGLPLVDDGFTKEDVEIEDDWLLIGEDDLKLVSAIKIPSPQSVVDPIGL